MQHPKLCADNLLSIATNYGAKCSLSMLFPVLLLMGAPAQAGQWHLQLDNDIIYGDDGNYTNGMVLGWSANLQQDLTAAPRWFQWQNKAMFNQDVTHQNWGITLTQQMWTPGEIELDTPQPYDRPYAGYLSIEAFSASYHDSLAQKNWLSVGVIGPASGTEHLQSFVHKITGSSEPKGWDHQIGNQLTLQAAYEIDTLLYRQSITEQTQWELSGFGHAQAGNFRSQADVGMIVRWGNQLSNNFGHLSQHTGHVGNITSVSQSSSWFTYARGFVGYRFNDLTLDGDLSYDSHAELENKQAGLDIGIVWAQSNWSVAWRFATYTKEYQSDPDRWHGYGSLLFAWSL
ncbi:lipid A deacylase LpxR family protein [Shewanella sp. Scap07]|uniref:lipid A deacylase LpxR family protein n=1 Tax=Shewanella sp. Scap07 TaxID=2589987 RepID=UPI0015BCD64B|nr:lipid A deacylase LpxR family protein [Shewanella sp. Scap07]